MHTEEKTPERLTKQALDGKSREEVLDIKKSIELEIGSIKAQISTAKSLAYSDGVYSNADWYRRATRALEIKKKKVAFVDRYLAKSKKASRESFAQHFVNICHESLAPEVFSSIKDEAKRRSGVGGDD